MDNKVPFWKQISNTECILNDLFITIQNIISGNSLVTRNECDKSIKYKIDSLSNQPAVLIIYEKNNIKQVKDDFVVNDSSILLQNYQKHGEFLSLQSEMSKDVNNDKMKFLNQRISESKVVEKQQMYLEAYEDENSNKKNFSCVLLTRNTSKYCNNGPGLCEKSNKSLEEEDQIIKDNLLLLSYKCANNPNKLIDIQAMKKPFPCSYCEKSFSFLSHKTYHERIHTGEKPFKCNYCDKAFKQRTHQESHERIHTGEKPYKCNYCEKAFRHLCTKRNHEKLHMEEKLLPVTSAVQELLGNRHCDS